jgi:hypothetical protein
MNFLPYQNKAPSVYHSTMVFIIGEANPTTFGGYINV